MAGLLQPSPMQATEDDLKQTSKEFLGIMLHVNLQGCMICHYEYVFSYTHNHLYVYILGISPTH